MNQERKLEWCIDCRKVSKDDYEYNFMIEHIGYCPHCYKWLKVDIKYKIKEQQERLN